MTDLQSTSNPDPADVRLRAAGLDSRPSGCSHRRPLPTQRMFGAVPLVWICNPDPLSIRIFNPPGNNVLSQNNTCGNKTATSSLSFLLMMIKNGIQNHSTFTGKERDEETLKTAYKTTQPSRGKNATRRRASAISVRGIWTTS